MRLDTRGNVLYTASFFCFCMAMYNAYELNAILSEYDDACHIDAWRWPVICLCTVLALFLSAAQGMYIESKYKRMDIFMSDVDVAVRGWKLDEERVRALMKNNADVFPHGQFIIQLLAYPPQYTGARTLQQVNAERAELLEHLEEAVRVRGHGEIVF